MNDSIFRLDFSSLADSAYLFSTTGRDFSLAGWALIMGLVGAIFSGLALWYFKKRRNKLKLEVASRQMVRRHSWINLGIWSAFLIYLLFRGQGVQFFSMRIFGYTIMLLALVNAIVATVLVLKSERDLKKIEVETSAQEDYTKYLPKKKKK